MEDSYFLRVEILRGLAEELGLDLDTVAFDIVKAAVQAERERRASSPLC